MTCFGMIAAVSLEALLLPTGTGVWLSPLLNHAGSLGLESEAECTLQCVYVLVCALFHFYFVVMKSMLPDAESASVCGEEVIKL